MARNSLLCADVPLRNYSLTHCQQHACISALLSVICMLSEVYLVITMVCLEEQTWLSAFLLPSRSYGDWLEDKGEDYQNRSVL